MMHKIHTTETHYLLTLILTAKQSVDSICRPWYVIMGVPHAHKGKAYMYSSRSKGNALSKM